MSHTPYCMPDEISNSKQWSHNKINAMFTQEGGLSDCTSVCTSVITLLSLGFMLSVLRGGPRRKAAQKQCVPSRCVSCKVFVIADEVHNFTSHFPLTFLAKTCLTYLICRVGDQVLGYCIHATVAIRAGSPVAHRLKAKHPTHHLLVGSVVVVQYWTQVCKMSMASDKGTPHDIKHFEKHANAALY